MRILKYLLMLVILYGCKDENVYVTIQPPGAQKYCSINPNGESVIPSGRIVDPYGEVIRITHDPFGLALSHDGKLAVAIHDNVLTLIETDNPQNAVRLPDYEGKYKDPFERKGSFMGAVFTRDNSRAYLGGGDSGEIILFDVNNLKSIKRISINGELNVKKYEDN